MKQTSILVNAIVYAGALLLYNTYGFTIPLYIIICLLAFGTFMITIASAASIYGFVDAKENLKELESEGKLLNNTKLMTFMLHVIQAMAIYTIYVAGFMFTSGIFSATLAVSFVGNILNSIKKERTE